MHAEHFCYGLIAADGAELSKRFEAEGLCGLGFQNPNDIERSLAALALRKLTCGCCGFVVEGVDDVRAVADSPSIGLSFDAHFGSGANPPALFCNIESLHNGRDRSADGADDCGAGQHASIVEFDTLMRCGNRAGIEQHGDSGFFHLFSGEFAEFGCYFGQDLVLGMNQADNHIFLAEILIKAGAAADKFIDFAGDFHPAEAGTHDDKAEMPSAEIGIRGGFGGFHLADDLLAKLDGVAHDLEGEGVVAHSGDDAEIGLRATGDDDMIVVQARQRAVAIVEPAQSSEDERSILCTRSVRHSTPGSI